MSTVFRQQFHYRLIFTLLCGVVVWLLLPQTAAAQTVWNATDWTLYDTITIGAANIDDDLTDFPVYVDLADLSSQFWSTTPTSSSLVGTDIRVTTDSGTPTELPRELVFASSTAQTGELHFKADTISSTTDTVFRIYYNGTTTGDYVTNSTYGAENVWSNGYIVVLHGDSFTDSTSNAYTFTQHGSATTTTTGQLGDTFTFAGTGDYLSRSTLPAFAGINAYSISAWSNLDTIGATDNADDGGIFTYEQDSGASNPSLLWYNVNADGTGDRIFSFNHGNTSDADNRANGATSPSASTWTHIVGQANGANREVFFNGVSDGTSASGDTVNTPTGEEVRIGGWRVTSNFDFDGRIDEFRISTTVFSDAWISAEYTNQSTTTDFYTASAAAGDVVWDGEAGDGLWETALNWDGNFVPNASSSVTIDRGETVYLTDTTTVTDLTLGSSTVPTTTELIILSNATTTADLTIHASATLASYTGARDLSVAGSFQQDGTYVNPGQITLTGTGETIGGTGSLGNIKISGTYTTSGANATTSSLTITSTGDYTAPTDTLTLTGSYQNDGSFTANGGTLTLNGRSVTLDGTLTGDDALAALTLLAETEWGEGGATTTDPGSSADVANAITSDADTLYVTGSCNGCNGASGNAYHTIAYNKTDGSIRWSTTTDPSSGSDTAYAITMDNDTLYVTGECDGCNGASNDAYHTIAYDKLDGSLRWSTTTDPGTGGDIARAITSDADTLYVTGECDGCNGASNDAYHTIAYDKLDGSLRWSTTTDPGSSIDRANAITSDADTLYVTGYTDVGSFNFAYHTVAYDKTNGSLLWSTTTDPSSSFDMARAITMDSDTLYVTGECDGCNGGPSFAYHTIAYDKTDGSLLWSTTTDLGSSFDTAYAITSDADTLYVTGSCDGCNGASSDAYHTVAYDKTNGSLLWSTTTDPSSDFDVAYAITSDADTLYVTGECFGCNGASSGAYHTVALSKHDGALLDGTLDADFASANASTSDLTITASTTLTAPSQLTIDGDFTQSGSFVANNGTVTMASTSSLTGSFTGDNTLHDLVVSGTTTLFVNASTSNLTIASGATLASYTGARDLSVAGSFQQDGTYVNPGTITLTGTGETIGGTNSLGNIKISGTYTTAGANATTSSLTITATGDYTAPTDTLTLTGSYQNDGSFTANGGTLTLNGRSVTLDGTLTGDDALAALTLLAETEWGEGGATTTDPSSGNDTAYAITMDNDTLYVTGDCFGCNGASGDAYHTIAYNKTDGSLRWSTTTDPGSGSDTAYAITMDNDTLYVTGECDGCNGASAQAYHTIAYDKLDGSLRWSTTTDPGTGGDIANAITSDADTLYVTGSCFGCNGASAQAYHTIAYDKLDGSLLWSTTTDPSSSFDVARAITLDADTLYVTGSCFGCNGALGFAYHTIAYNKTDGSLRWSTTTDPSSGSAYAITSDADTLYVTGECFGCNGASSGAYHTIAYDKTDGSLLWSTTTDPSSGSDIAYAITSDADTLYVTGSCDGCNGASNDAYHTIAYDKLDGSLRWSTTTDPGSSSDVANAITSDADILYITGECFGCNGASGNAYHTVALSKHDGALLDGYTDLTFGDAASTTDTFTATAPSSTVTFNAGSTYTFENIDWQGSAGNELRLQSSASGTEWFLDIPGSQLNVEYVNVQDSDASVGPEITAASSTDSGNNTNWTFGASAGPQDPQEWNPTDWTQYDEITIKHENIDESLTDFPVYVDLADLSSQFWSITPGSAALVGTDIRVTTGTSTPYELPRELVFASSTAQTGELHFKADFINKDADTTFRIYYNGTTTGDYAIDATYGAEAVWDTAHQLVTHAAGDADSTVNGVDGTTAGGVSVGSAVGQVGDASNFDGSSQYIDYDSYISDFSSESSGAVSLWAKRDTTSNRDTLFSIGEDSGNANRMIIELDAGSGDARFIIREAGVNTIDIAGGDVENLHWNHIVATQDNTTGGRLYVNGVDVTGTPSANTTDWFDAISAINYMRIGQDARTLGGPLYADATIDDVRIYSSSLSDAEISAMYVNQSTTTDFYTLGVGTSGTGSTTLSDHDDTQINNAFSFQNVTNEPLFAFKLTPESGTATITELTIEVRGAQQIDPSDFSNLTLYRDPDGDATYNASDSAVGGTGVFTLGNRGRAQNETQLGTIVFSDDFVSTTTQNYLVVGDWNAPEKGAALTLDLRAEDIEAIDGDGAHSFLGAVDDVQHNRQNQGGGGGGGNHNDGGAVGGPAPEGDGDVSGGTNDGGDLIGDEDNDFYFPASTTGSSNWSNPENAYDGIDGTYASNDTDTANQQYLEYDHGVPGGDEIEGIEVKLEVSNTLINGTFVVALSWDGGSSWTSNKTTPSIGTTDTVVSLGGASDTWGRSWTANEFSDSNFRMRISGTEAGTLGTDVNIAQIDAIQVKVYHQASGGSQGGGGSGGSGGAI